MDCRKNVIVQFQKFALENISQTGCQKKVPHKNKANRKKKKKEKKSILKQLKVA
jgi:hypothetical protein